MHRAMTMTIPPAPVRTDVKPRPLERLEAELVELASQIAGATARFISLLGEFDAAEGWRDWGMKSTAHWLAWKCGLGLVTGREHVRVARALRDLPVVSAEFAAGRLSFSKVRAITRLATPATEGQLVDVARAATAAQLDRLLSRHRRARRANGLDEHAKSEHLNYHYDDEGFLVGSFRIAPERAPVVGHGLDVMTGRIQELDSEGDETSERTPRRRRSRADALVEMCERAVDDASAEASPLAAERYQLVIHSSAESLARPDHADDEGSATELQAPGGLTVRLSPATARRLTCDCPSIRMVDGTDGSAVHVGRKTRRINRRLRRAVNARDRGMCQAPGCTERATQIHHIRHWANGGPTCLTNLISLCDGHHWLVHEGNFTIVPRGGRDWAFIGPAGVTVESTATPMTQTEPFSYDPNIAADAVSGHWDGERLRHRAFLDTLTRPLPTPPKVEHAPAEAPQELADTGQISQAMIDHWLTFVADLDASGRPGEGIWVDD